MQAEHPTSDTDDQLIGVDAMIDAAGAALADYREHIAATDLAPADHVALWTSSVRPVQVELRVVATGLAAQCATVLAWHDTLREPYALVVHESERSGPCLTVRGTMAGGTPLTVECFPNEEELQAVGRTLWGAKALAWLQHHATVQPTG